MSETTEAAPSPYRDDGWQWAWNSSTLKPAKQCWRKYYYEVRLGLSTKSSKPDLVFGSHYARALEHYHRLRYTHAQEHHIAQQAVIHQLMKDTAEWRSDHNFKNRETLVRSVIWYLEEFKDDPCRTILLHDGQPAVELPFQFEVTPNITLVGHLDRLVEYGGNIYVQDQKAQPSSTHVLTLTGWRCIGDLEVGDEIIGKDGTPKYVKALHPKGKTDVYRVSFNDKTSVLCGVDHLWTVSTQMNEPWATVDLLYLKEHLAKRNWKKYHIPLVDPIQHPQRDLPLDPYVLGVLLGDGYFGGNTPCLSTSHAWLAESVAVRLPEGDTISKYDADNYTWGIKGQKTTQALKDLGLWGKLSTSKFVPAMYLYASEAQRRELLRGLLVTDGTWDGIRRKYDSTSIHLIDAVCALVRSLGGNARYHKRTGADAGWRVSLRLPELPSKAGKRYITDITKEGQDETICIEVDAADGLYVTENYIVTHNTTGSTIGSYYFKRYNPDVQMSLYSLAAEVVWKTPVSGVMVDAAQIAVGFTRFERGFSFRTKDQLQEWLRDTIYVINGQSEAEAAGWPMNDSACMLYGGCPFQEVCSKDPRVRDAYLETAFERRDTNPLRERV